MATYVNPGSAQAGSQGTVHREVSPEQRAVEQQLVDTVVASFDACGDPRLRELMVSLVRHLHSFVREVRLTEEEWGAASDFLAKAGHITDGVRQEFILLSDTLSASMQTINVNNQAYRGATEATVFGPLSSSRTPPRSHSATTWPSAPPASPAGSRGTVTDTDGNPLAGARIEVWEADEDGLYDVQYDAAKRAARAHLFAGADGGYRFWGLTPTPYPIPDDGPVGKMLDAVGRSPLRAAHLHFMVSHESARTLVTHIFPEGDPIGRKDTVFGVKDSLIKRFERRAADAPTPDGSVVDGTWSRVRFDIVLAPVGV